MNRVDNTIFEKNLKCQVNGDFEDIRKHIEWQQADVVARGEYNEDRVAVLSVLSQFNHIIERLYSDITEEDLDEEYKKFWSGMMKLIQSLKLIINNVFISKK